MDRSKTSTSKGYASAFGRALDEQLSKRSMRPADLANSLNVSPAYVSRLMNGASTASPQSVSKLAIALNLGANETSSLMAAASTTKGYSVTVCPHCGKEIK